MSTDKIVRYPLEIPAEVRDALTKKAQSEGRTVKFVLLQFINAYVRGDKLAKQIIEKK